jgi:hypothetical protein
VPKRITSCYTSVVITTLPLLALPFLLTVALGLQSPVPVAKGVASSPIVGTWQLMTRTVTRADGSRVIDPVLGEKPTGRLIYEASGVMSLQMMRAGRKDAMSTAAGAGDKANPRVILGYDSYFGRYTVHEKTGTVTHHVEGSLFPEDLGEDWVRPFTLKGNTLTLRLTSEDGLTRTLVFQRVNADRR